MSARTLQRTPIGRRRLAPLALLALLMLLPAAGQGQQPTQQPPQPQPARRVNIPDFADHTLDNGLRVVILEHREQPSVSLRLVLQAGNLYAPADRPGLAGAVTTLLTQGTTTRSAQQIAAAIDFVGGALDTNSGDDLAAVSAFVTSDQLDLGLALLADVVLHPTFPAEEVERWRTRALSGLQVNLSSPAYLAGAAFNRALFGEHPYGQPDDGTLESVGALTRDDLVSFHRRHYLPNGAILAVVGDVRPEQALAKVRQAFGGWPRGEAPQPPRVAMPELATRRLVVVDKPDAVQTQIRVGQTGVAYGDPDFFTAHVYNTIVGGGVSARLYEEIRRKRGLSYGANSSLTPQLQPGAFVASTFTKSESTVETLGLVLAVLDGMKQELVPAEELLQRKTFVTGAFPMLLETPNGLAEMVLQVLPYGLDKAFLDSYRDRLDAVTAEQVRDFARRRIHPERTLVVLVGNAAAFAAELEKTYGSFETVPLAQLDLMQASLRQPAVELALELVDEFSAEEVRQARELAEKGIAALGGQAFLDQRSQVARGTAALIPPGAPQPIAVDPAVSYMEWPAKVRTEFTVASIGLIVQAYDGEHGWGQVRGQLQDISAMMSSRLPYGFFALRRFDPQTFEIFPLPDTTLGGRTLLGVELTDPEGHVNQLYLDAQSHLLVKMSYEVGGQTFEEHFEDFRLRQGLQVPHRTTYYENGRKILEITFSQVDVNVEVDDALFARPAG